MGEMHRGIEALHCQLNKTIVDGTFVEIEYYLLFLKSTQVSIEKDEEKIN